jgi:type IV secretion system protein TrbI
VDNSSTLLNPGSSPDRSQSTGVRRLNHLPLLIIGAVVSVVVLLLVWIVVDVSTPKPGTPADHGGDSSVFAQQITDSHTGWIQPVYHPTPAPVTTPSTAASSVPAPDTRELESRKTAFYSALGATSAVEDMNLNPQTGQQQVPVPRAAPVTDPDKAEALNAMGQQGPNFPTPAPDPNALSTYNGTKDRWTLNTHLEKPSTPYVLRTGWVIPALMLTAMESELPGTITAQVSQDVFDTPSGKYLLIPQGSRLVGEYSNAIQYGQARIFVAWQRIIYPDGSALDIGAMPGSDGQGEAGFRDQVDNHFIRLFGSALLMSAISGATALSQPQQNISNAPNLQSALSAALGQQLGAATSSLLEKNLSIPPTLKIRQGYAFNVVVIKDLTFQRPYVVPNY